jgi:hypothetical protein
MRTRLWMARQKVHTTSIGDALRWRSCQIVALSDWSSPLLR